MWAGHFWGTIETWLHGWAEACRIGYVVLGGRCIEWHDSCRSARWSTELPPLREGKGGKAVIGRANCDGSQGAGLGCCLFNSWFNAGTRQGVCGVDLATFARGSTEGFGTDRAVNSPRRVCVWVSVCACNGE
jgi:hypothetical protein